MHRVQLTYTIGSGAAMQRDLHHPLMALLGAVHDTGSISGAARRLELSYRHVWGELKRWEGELGQELVLWVKGQPALLSPFGEKLLWAERRAQARLAPQIEALRSELEQAFAIAFDERTGVIPLTASHDDALPLLVDTNSVAAAGPYMREVMRRGLPLTSIQLNPTSPAHLGHGNMDVEATLTHPDDIAAAASQ